MSSSHLNVPTYGMNTLHTECLFSGMFYNRCIVQLLNFSLDECMISNIEYCVAKRRFNLCSLSLVSLWTLSIPRFFQVYTTSCYFVLCFFRNLWMMIPTVLMVSWHSVLPSILFQWSHTSSFENIARTFVRRTRWSRYIYLCVTRFAFGIILTV